MAPIRPRRVGVDEPDGGGSTMLEKMMWRWGPPVVKMTAGIAGEAAKTSFLLFIPTPWFVVDQ